MGAAGSRDRLIVVKRPVTVADEYGGDVSETAPIEVARAMASVRFGSAQEKREAAQEKALQSATFECLRTPKLHTVLMTDYIDFDGSSWDIVEKAELDRRNIRFTATRSK